MLSFQSHPDLSLRQSRGLILRAASLDRETTPAPTQTRRFGSLKSSSTDSHKRLWSARSHGPTHRSDGPLQENSKTIGLKSDGVSIEYHDNQDVANHKNKSSLTVGNKINSNHKYKEPKYSLRLSDSKCLEDEAGESQRRKEKSKCNVRIDEEISENDDDENQITTNKKVCQEHASSSFKGVSKKKNHSKAIKASKNRDINELANLQSTSQNRPNSSENRQENDHFEMKQVYKEHSTKNDTHQTLRNDNTDHSKPREVQKQEQANNENALCREVLNEDTIVNNGNGRETVVENERENVAELGVGQLMLVIILFYENMEYLIFLFIG